MMKAIVILYDFDIEYGLEKYVVGFMYSGELREKEHPVYLQSCLE